MGKDKKKKIKKEDRPPQPYTESERNKKLMLIRMQLMDIDMHHLITPEVNDAINDFIKTGREFHKTVDIPEYSRELEVNLINDKRKQTYITLKFKKIVVDGGNMKNPINKLNRIQEELL